MNKLIFLLRKLTSSFPLHCENWTVSDYCEISCNEYVVHYEIKCLNKTNPCGYYSTLTCKYEELATESVLSNTNALRNI